MNVVVGARCAVVWSGNVGRGKVRFGEARILCNRFMLLPLGNHTADIYLGRI